MIIHPPVSQRPVIYPVPDHVFSVSCPKTDLNGIWQLAFNPSGPYWLSDAPDISWQNTVVPSDLSALFSHANNRTPPLYVYRREIQIPEDFSGKHVFLRFEGSYGLTRVYADGLFAGSHSDGFVTWYCDLTPFVTAGQPCLLTISIENQDEVSTFNQGGLVRPLSLIALPDPHLTRLHVETLFDENSGHATLQVLFGAAAAPDVSLCEPVRLNLSLFDPDDNLVFQAQEPVSLVLHQLNPCFSYPVHCPVKWDAEHPNLYRLQAELQSGNTVIEKVSRKFGFRSIRREENHLYVNGDEVKLRGVCRHDISPLNGRTVTEEELKKDILLFKEANINYIRTSHYPPSEKFLDLCDEIGFYVEDEIGLAFIGRTLKETERSPAHAKRYLTFFSELIERDRSHPCVLIWSLANESFYGPNFALLNAYAHQEDPSRLTKFSYPMTMREEDDPVDIWSIHYIHCDADLSKKYDNVGVGYLSGRDMPVLHDEYAHVPCYNRDEQRRDPAVRNFWGESIRRFWDRIWHTPGALGGAIWAGIDEVSFASPGRILEWGLIDVWRRPKPEYWLTRKAYSPVHLPRETFDCPKDLVLTIPVENRFCHTNLNELTATYEIYSEKSSRPKERGSLPGPPVPPYQSGNFCLSCGALEPGDHVRLNWKDQSGRIVDCYELQIEPPEKTLPLLCGKAPSVTEDKETVRVEGSNFKIVWDRRTGQIRSGCSQGVPVLKGGPDLHLTGLTLSPWSCQDFQVEKQADAFILKSHGRYGSDAVITFTTRIDACGLMQVTAVLEEWNQAMPPAMKIRVGVHPGGLDEWGISFLLDGAIDAVSWSREAAQSGFPDDHIGRSSGIAWRHNGGRDPAYGEKPGLPWSMDEKSYSLYGPFDPGLRGTNDFRAAKHHLIFAELLSKEKTLLQVLSDGTHSLRLEQVPDPALMIDDRDPSMIYRGRWFRDQDAGYYGGTETKSRTAGDSVTYQFSGTGAAWIGSSDVINGIANIYVDGVRQQNQVNQRVAGVEFAGSSIGFDKKYQLVQYAITNLTDGPHTLRIEVAGKKSPDAEDCLIGIDCFRIIKEKEDDVRMMILEDYNYPRLSWGNDIRPAVCIKTGSQATCFLKLVPEQEEADNA